MYLNRGTIYLITPLTLSFIEELLTEHEICII